ncbi:MAG: metallophosphoesterase family protein [Actinomycetota bacterium]|nr:metallophosphoesterase family protein [Actinomycetota bacterium]
MRTLVVSDLHLGAQTQRDVLRDRSALDALTAAVAGCDRLVLLGDILELRHGPQGDALGVAEEPLRAIGAALGAEREVVLVAGNHDHHLLDRWLERRAQSGPEPALDQSTEVNLEPGDTMATLAGWLAPARVRAAYPGLWLRSDVYATHGHYADCHMTMPTLERLGAGVMTRITGRPESELRSSEHYEEVLAPIYAWIHALAQRLDPELGGSLHGGSVRGWRALTGPGRRGLRRRALAAGFPGLIALLNRAQIGPLEAELSGSALRRAGLRGMETVATRLGVDARYLIFGHTHRAGPQSGDALQEWRTATGTELINSGCWVIEPGFLGPNPSRSPYRAGFAVWVGEQGPPELVNLLDAGR